MHLANRQYPKGQTYGDVRRHYEVEKSIAERLKKTTREERKRIYPSIYKELFEKVPSHGRRSVVADCAALAKSNRNKMGLINKYLNKNTVFVEFGSGDCEFALSICGLVKSVLAIDISDQRLQLTNLPDNFKFVIFNGYDLDIGKGFADMAFSDQVIEHLHPDDTLAHFQLVYSVLKQKGIYFFRTPHRYSGPHDISRYFSNVAEGFHLKEWSYKELIRIIKNAGFSSYDSFWYGRGMRIRVPTMLFVLSENILKIAPRVIRKKISRYLYCNNLTMAVTK